MKQKISEKKLKTFFFISFIYLFIYTIISSTFGQTPKSWESRGIGGGGAFFAPSFNPHNPGEMFLTTDMGNFYRTKNYGASWTMYPFTMITGNRNHTVKYTKNRDILYFSGYRNSDAHRSIDGGETWTSIGGSYSLFVDYENPLRIIKNSWSSLLISYDGGETWYERFDANDNNAGLHLAGVHFDQNIIVVPTNKGLLISTDSGANFTIDSTLGGIPEGEYYMSFTSAKQGDRTRFFCITSKRVFNGINAGDRYDANGIYQSGAVVDSCGVYRLDWGVETTWNRCDVGQIDPTYTRAFVRMASNNISVAYVTVDAHNGFPSIYKTSDGGNTWNQTLFPLNNNQDIQTGWGGRKSRFEWFWGGRPVSLNVDPFDPDKIAFTDFFWIHLSTDGGATWRQAYTSPSNSANQVTPYDSWYTGVGLENTSCWWLTWTSPSNIFASFTDKSGMRSDDGGNRWTFDFSYAGKVNSTYQAIRHSNGSLYAATSSVHDLYNGGWSSDDKIDQGRGMLVHSNDGGATWETIWETKPLVWLCEDPQDSEILYASVVNNTDKQGGIWRISNLSDGINSVKTKLADPPRTEGHPLTIEVCDDGMLVATYASRNLAPWTGTFQPSSGVFVSEDGGDSWIDRSHPNMYYRTRDLIIDPHDLSQNTWYVAVNDGWGGASNNLGGLYRTTNRGISWDLLLDANVNSCTVSPVDPNVIFVTTTDDGLWFSSNLRTSGQVTFSRVDSFPARNVMRVFFNPYNYKMDELWVTTFGNSMRVGNVEGMPQSAPDLRPDSLIAEALLHNTVKLRWKDNTTTESCFRIERRQPGQSWQEVGKAYANETQFEDTSLTAVTNYEYRVFANNQAGDSPPSNNLSVKTASLPPPVAVAGPDQIVLNYTLVTLNGSNSSGYGEQKLSYKWTQISGPAVDLDGASSASPTFVAPADTSIRFNLTVTADGQSSTDSVTITSQETTPVPFAGLVNAWLFEESGTTVTNSVDSAFDGALAASPASPTRTTGKIGDALSFDGFDDRVHIPAFNLSGNTFTMSLWMNLRAQPNDGRLLSKASGESGNDHTLMLSTYNQDQRLRFRIKTDASSTTSTIITPADVFNFNTWHHVAVTYDGTTVRILVDGTTVASGSVSGNIAQTGDAVALGNQPVGAGDRPMDGMLDQVRIYNRVLSSEELTLLRNESAPIEDVAENAPPVANAGSDLTVIDANNDGREIINLDGTGSSDSDGSIITYIWRDGETTLVSGATPSVTLPVGIHTLTLSIVDDDGATASDTVQITITRNTPVAHAGPDQIVASGTLVTLDASNSSAPDENVLTYTWTQTSGPAVTLSDPNSVRPTFTAIADTTVTFNLAVTAGGQSSTDSVSITSETAAEKMPENTTPDNYVWEILELGSLQYVDRTYSISDIPDTVVGLPFLRTANNDKNLQDTALIGFTVNQHSIVYVAHDDQYATKPGWLADFVDTGDNIVSGGGTFSLWKKEFPAGTVTLGENAVSGSGNHSMYSVIVETISGLTAEAGADQAVVDIDSNGVQAVSLNGSNSTALSSTIVDYAWYKDGGLLASGAQPSLNLDVGIHVITLTVTNDAGLTASDTVTVHVSNGARYVSTTGSDTTGDGTIDSPWASITHATQNCADGEIILVKPGIYYGLQELQGQWTQGITVRSEIPYQAQLRNNDTVVMCYYGQNITFSGFDIAHDGPGAGPLLMHVQNLRSTENPVGKIGIRNNIFRDSYNDDLLNISNGVIDITVEGNLFYNQQGSNEHIEINSVENVIVQDNVFFNDFAGSGRSDTDTRSFVVVKDSNGATDGFEGSRNVTLRRNVMLNYAGSPGAYFILFGDEGKDYPEAFDCLVENNLLMGNSSYAMRAPFGVKGCRDITFRHNTIVGDTPASAFAMRLNREGANLQIDNIYFYNNVWSDSTGTMEDFSDTVLTDNDTLFVALDNNAYWNNDRSIPYENTDLVNFTDDPHPVTGDPRLGSQHDLVIPRWQPESQQFADGSQTIEQVFTQLVSRYGTPGDGSALIDAANPAYAPEEDILGEPRPAGTPPDIGALERVPTYATWLASYNPTISGNDAAPTADSDGNSVSNLYEYAFDFGAPGEYANLLPVFEVFEDGNEQWAALVWRQNNSASELNFIVEYSYDLSIWHPVTIDGVDFVRSVIDADIDGDLSASLIETRARVTTTDNLYLRLVVELEN